MFVSVVLLAGAALSWTTVMPPPAMPGQADTEVSTNIAFNVDEAHLREFEMRFVLEGGLSNGIQVAFGRGLRRFTATNNVGVAVLPSLSADAQKWLCRPDWNMMRVTRRGPGVPSEWFSCDVSSRFFCFMLR